MKMKFAFLKRFSFAENLPQQNAEAVDVELGGAWLIDVPPVLRRNMSDRSSATVMASHFRRVLLPARQTKVRYLTAAMCNEVTRLWRPEMELGHIL